MKPFKNVFVILTLLFTALFIASCDGNGGDDKDSGTSGDSIVCTYYMKDDTSVYYVFYGDKTAEYHANGKIKNTRSELIYSGYPLKAGTVSLKISSTGTELISFNVKESNGTLIPTVELVPGFPVEYTLTLDGENNNGENEDKDKENQEGSGGNENQGDESEPIDTPIQSDTNTDVLCAWIADGDSSNYYIFYTDNTAEYYAGNVLQSARDALTYTGSPSAEGTVKITNKNTVPILIAAGKGTLTFTLEMSDSCITARETSSGLIYIVTTNIPSSTDNNNDGDNTTSYSYDIITICSEHGSITADKRNATAGEIVTLTVVSDDGYKLEHINVYDSSYNLLPIKEVILGEEYTFTMPESNVSIWASCIEISPETYNITISSDIENGTLTADKGNATAGDLITLTVIPNDGYELDNVFIYDDSNNLVSKTSNAERNKYTFTMPESNVEVECLFKIVLPSYAIVISNDIINGTVTTSKTSAKKGESVKLIITQDEGYDLKKLIVADSNGNNISNGATVTERPNTSEAFFTMPDSDVLVSATFKGKITILSGIENGTVSANLISASQGESVSLSLSPDDGYELSSVTVTDDAGNVITFTDTWNWVQVCEYRFIMPERRVFVSATFTSLPTYTVTFDSNGGSKVESQNIMTGKTATMPENPTKIGYIFMGWYTSNNFESQYKFNFTSIIKDEITLYAKWGSPIEDFVFVIGSTYNGSTELNPPSAIFTEGNTITIKDLFVCEHEVTQAEYETYCKYGETQPNSSEGKGNNYPAYYVNWYDAIIYCNLRSMAENLTPVYSINGITNPTNWSGIEVNANGKYCGPSSALNKWDSLTFNTTANGYRLPTEAEWEYIARGGNGGIPVKQYEYAGSDTVDEVAWIYENSNGKSHEVTKKLPNTLGIYDMSGNVGEWCWDSIVDSSNLFREYRGSSWTLKGTYAKIWSQYATFPYYRRNYLGFRVVRNAE